MARREGKSNDGGNVIQYLKKRHAQQGEAAGSLEEFARTYRPRGEKLIAAATVSRLRDLYYGQWMALHVPFKRFEACALETAPDYWANEPQIRKDMELEAYSDDHIATVLAWIRAQRRCPKFPSAWAVPERLLAISLNFRVTQ